jgi:hypothetical protein
MHFMPIQEFELENDRHTSKKEYQCPLYKVADACQSVDTYKSDNMVMYISLPSDKSQKYWIRAGASAFLSYE